MTQGHDPVQAILSRALAPAELARRAADLLDRPDAHRLLPEVLHALGVVADEDAASPLAGTLLAQVRRLAAPGEATRRALREALEVGWLFPLAAGVVEMLHAAGEDLAALRADAVARAADPAERRRALSLLCALGTGEWAVLLEAETDHAGRLEGQRAHALADVAALPALVAALDDGREAVRMRAEAALLLLGERAAPAARALLHMPPWTDGDERPSPVLRVLGEAARPALEEALAGDGVARRRAEALLRPTPGPEMPSEPNPIDHLAALSAETPADRQAAFQAVFRAWFAGRLPPGLRGRLIEASLDRLDRLGWLPSGPLRVDASPRGLRRGVSALCWLCLRMEPSLVVAACRVLALAEWPGPVPLLGRLLGALAGHHHGAIAEAAVAAAALLPQDDG